ncbi:DNA-directed RNA polymerase subunit D [Candidatus Micrarchaeota archaeon]|nr:DNA-directed RNA polymerase subunit D [Candidatus Micrarchaeota archaeon]
MKLTLDKLHGNRIEFIATDVPTSFANMVRRYSMSRIPVMAISTVVVYDNTSALWDEYISHRLGLLPISTPEGTPESAEVTFTLDAEGPKIAYSNDLKSTDKDIVAANKIPIITLGEKQRIRLEAKADLATGKKHARYQAGLVSYGIEGKGLRMFVESFYQMEPKEVIGRACDIILSDIEKIEAAFGKKKK